MIAEKLGSYVQTLEQFKDSFAKLDFDGDDEVTIDEMINYE